MPTETTEGPAEGRLAELKAEGHSRAHLAPLALAALGVVFGDIGTSPLYAFRLCFIGGHFPASHENVLGILSLIFWALTGVVCVNYASIILRANHDGEGGILALLALLKPASKPGSGSGLPVIALLVLLGAGMLYGDGVITPAISVLSAVEGLGVATPSAEPFILPLTVAIMAALFFVQRYGTGRIGRVFGPVMVLWFLSIAVAGAASLAHHPAVLWALDPRHAIGFIVRNRWPGILVLGAVVLCVSGVEALYADLGHFGLRPIQAAWFFLAYPALLLNYFGQGALVLVSPEAITAPFYHLVAGWAQYPMVVLATAATVIASQALISGVFSLTQQAVQLGFSPRVRVVQTSRHHRGRIYMPFVTVLLAIASISVVLTFRHSDRLGAAYGLAVTVTMLATSITYLTLARQKWGWAPWRVALAGVSFLTFDLSFLTGNIPKLAAGGWIPASIAIVIFTLFTTWVEGRRRLAVVYNALSTPTDEFLREVGDRKPDRASGTAVVLTTSTSNIPFALRHDWLRHELLHEQVVLLTIVADRRPYVRLADRVVVTPVSESLVRVSAHYGFTQQPRVAQILALCKRKGDPAEFREPIYYFIPRPRILTDRRPGAMAGWRRALYRVMLRNATPLSDSLGLPANRVIEFGVATPV